MIPPVYSKNCYINARIQDFQTVSKATVHGLRSSFRDWCGDNTNFTREVCEAALVHAVENQIEAAYRRSDLFEKRRNLMMQWEKYLYG